METGDNVAIVSGEFELDDKAKSAGPKKMEDILDEDARQLTREPLRRLNMDHSPFLRHRKDSKNW